MSAAACAVEPRGIPRLWSKTCGVCRRTYSAPDWRALVMVTLLPAAGVQMHLSVPAAWCVELRDCLCGAVLAARVP